MFLPSPPPVIIMGDIRYVASLNVTFVVMLNLGDTNYGEAEEKCTVRSFICVALHQILLRP
jgi:hypothetical protein